MCHLARPIAREEESNAGFDFIRVMHPENHGKKEE